MKTEARSGLHDAQRLLVELEKSLLNDPLASGPVLGNKEDTLEVLYYRSGRMKQLFHKFHGILLVDAIYSVNGVGMPLYCLMVEDGFGHGRVVHYATTTEEDTEHLRKIVQSFKDENSAWSDIHVIVVDKDFTEWKVVVCACLIVETKLSTVISAGNGAILCVLCWTLV